MLASALLPVLRFPVLLSVLVREEVVRKQAEQLGSSTVSLGLLPSPAKPPTLTWPCPDWICFNLPELHQLRATFLLIQHSRYRLLLC